MIRPVATLLALSLCGCVDLSQSSTGESSSDDNSAALLSPNSALVLDIVKKADASRRARLRFLAVNTIDGGNVSFSAQLCTFEVAANSISAHIDPALYAGQPPMAIAGTLDTSGAAPTLQTTPAALVLGANLADPINDPLPTDPNDPQVADPERDGHPGFTVDAEYGRKAYGDLRLVFSFAGAITAGAVTAVANSETPQFNELGDNVPTWIYDVKKYLSTHPLLGTVQDYEMVARLLPLDGASPGCGKVNALAVSDDAPAPPAPATP